MKIMTFNTQHCQNYLDRKINFDLIAKTITDCDADIIGLNEMRNKGAAEGYEDQMGILSDLTDIPYCYFAMATDFGGAKPYGNGLLSRKPILEATTIPIPTPSEKQYNGYYEPRCILKAKIAGGITVLVTHFGLNPDEQENAVKTVLENLENEKCILMGDFNLPPESELLDPIRVQMKDTADLFLDPLHSFPSDLPRIKIDYLFVSKDIKVVAADIPPIVASDHRPHTATIRVPQR